MEGKLSLKTDFFLLIDSLNSLKPLTFPRSVAVNRDKQDFRNSFLHFSASYLGGGELRFQISSAKFRVDMLDTPYYLIELIKTYPGGPLECTLHPLKCTWQA